MKKGWKRYRLFFIVVISFLLLILFNHQLGMRALNITAYSLKEMILVLPPIFVLLGLLDIWVPRETMVKYMGEGSGVIGVVISIIIGSAAAGPLYGAFPVAAVFMKKGVKFTNILIFIGAWSTTKIPMLLFEAAALGTEFAVTRLLVDIPGIILIAMILEKMVSKAEIEKIYLNASNFDHS